MVNILHCYAGRKSRIRFRCDLALKERIQEFKRTTSKIPFAGTVNLLMIMGYLYMKANPWTLQELYISKGEIYHTALTVSDGVYIMRCDIRKLVNKSIEISQNTLVHYGLVAHESGFKMELCLTN